MKKLLVILLIALTTCATVKKRPEDYKKNPFAPRYASGRGGRGGRYVVNKFPIKGINGLFYGKVREIFRKLEDMVKKGIAWLIENNLWNPIIKRLKNHGQKYGIELCEQFLSPEVCGPAIDFALKLLIPNEQN